MLKVGELAERTGLSVRALHHYDEIGLLTPAGRTGSGHRLYGVDEISRLQRIKSLRQLGLSLEEIRSCLERPEFSLERVIGLHLELLREQIELQERLRDRLERIAGYLRQAGTVAADELLKTIEVITMSEKFEQYYTPEQLEALRERREVVEVERIQAVQQQWADLFERFGAEQEKGADPASEPVQTLAREAIGLIAEFTGGDAGTEGSLGRMVAENRGDMYQMWGVDPGVGEFMGRAMAVLNRAAGSADGS